MPAMFSLIVFTIKATIMLYLDQTTLSPLIGKVN